MNGTAVANIFNLSGHLILRRMLAELDNQIEVQKLPGGIYFVEVTTASGTTRSKLVKQ